LLFRTVLGGLANDGNETLDTVILHDCHPKQIYQDSNLYVDASNSTSRIITSTSLNTNM